MGEQPIYHNCASMCSVCEGKKGAKKIYIPLLFVYYRNYTDMLLIVLLGLITKLALVSGDCILPTTTINDLDWNRVGISVLTCLL
jgi:hypothetical protein